MRLVIKTGSIDMYGANGRDFHPTKDDAGILVAVDKVETESWDCCGEEDCPCCNGTGLNEIKIFTGVAPDGRTLEIMDYEVASITLEEK